MKKVSFQSNKLMNVNLFSKPSSNGNRKLKIKLKISFSKDALYFKMTLELTYDIPSKEAHKMIFPGPIIQIIVM